MSTKHRMAPDKGSAQSFVVRSEGISSALLIRFSVDVGVRRGMWCGHDIEGHDVEAFDLRKAMKKASESAESYAL